jgi:hypothetical protein
MLPVAELVVSALLAGPPAFHLLRHPPQLCRTAAGEIVYDMRDPAVRRWLNKDISPFPPRFDDVWYLNFPGAAGEVALSLKAKWAHPYFPAWSWRVGTSGFFALTWPIWALPFWFAAGRGLDGFFRDGRISALEAFVMGAQSLPMGLVVMIALLASDRAYQRWAVAPAAMWLAFGVICQIAWWRQRRHTFGRYGDGTIGRWMRRHFW